MNELKVKKRERYLRSQSSHTVESTRVSAPQRYTYEDTCTTEHVCCPQASQMVDLSLDILALSQNHFKIVQNKSIKSYWIKYLAKFTRFKWKKIVFL